MTDANAEKFFEELEAQHRRNLLDGIGRPWGLFSSMLPNEPPILMESFETEEDALQVLKCIAHSSEVGAAGPYTVALREEVAHVIPRLRGGPYPTAN